MESIQLYNYFQACMQVKEEKEILQISHDAPSESRTLTNNFLIHNCKINHQNTLDIEVNQNKDEGLHIKNYFIKINNKQVSKLTQIQLGRKIIKIVDKFTSNQYTPHINSTIKMGDTEIINESSKKTIIESKPKVKDSHMNRIMKIRDTKNIVKNIFRLFQMWVEDRAPKELNLTSQLNGMLNDNGKYNNSLIIMLTKNKKLKQAFKVFIQTDGQHHIKQSRIRDKQSHLKALRRYSRICVNEQIAQQENEDDMEIESNINKKSKAEQRLNGSTDSGSGSGNNNGGTSPKDSSGQGKEVQT